MTTSTAFGIDKRISDPLVGEQIEHAPVEQTQTPVQTTIKQERPVFDNDQKREILRKAVEKFIAGLISQDELNTIYKITE